MMTTFAYGLVQRIRVLVNCTAEIIVKRHEKGKVRVNLRVVQRMIPAHEILRSAHGKI